MYFDVYTKTSVYVICIYISRSRWYIPRPCFECFGSIFVDFLMNSSRGLSKPFFTKPWLTGSGALFASKFPASLLAPRRHPHVVPQRGIREPQNRHPQQLTRYVRGIHGVTWSSYTYLLGILLGLHMFPKIRHHNMDPMVGL